MTECITSDIPRSGPTAPSRDDHPADYPSRFSLTSRWRLGRVSIRELIGHPEHCVGGVHQAACYRNDPDAVAYWHHDVADDDYAGQNYDVAYIFRMAKSPERLPPLVVTKAGMFGGGHRTAAWHEAGWTDAPAWIEQDDQDNQTPQGDTTWTQ